jgi:gentisate 1,2-dioxygenase
MPDEAAKTSKTGNEATRFKPGQSGNPGGKPVNARNKLQTEFLNKLAKDFAENGEEAILQTRQKDPARYLQIVAALMPKQVEQTQPMDDMTNAEFLAALEDLRQRVAGNHGTGVGSQTEPAQLN